LALLAGSTAAALAALIVGPGWSTSASAAVAGCALLALVGLTDDLFGLAAQPRLLAQALIGAAIGAALGGWGVAAFGAVVIPAAVNMVNFMDGINGICAAHAAVWGAGALAASSHIEGDVLAVVGALSLGGGLGFLPWNVLRARLFLGDVGSYLIGGLAGVGVLAAFSALSPSRGEASSVWPLIGLVCGPYVLFAVDTASALVQRLRTHQPLFAAHRSHVYQRLANECGFPHWAVSAFTATLSVLVTIAFAISALTGWAAAATASALYLMAPRLVARRVIV
jgi:UDP-N-acetylmuramyl pentapeptide phosphotransferase/UDP-N-acetylglucosamine-1-phosphate transferase